MFDKVRKYIIPHLLGLALIVLGWFIAIFDASWDRFSQSKALFSNASMLGLFLILIGAYLPDVWVAILKKREK